MLVREYAPGCYAQLGMGAGQPNRIDSTRKLALTKARENIAALHAAGGDPRPLAEFEKTMLAVCVMVSDAFFPFPDNVEVAAEAGLKFIVQPGGSKKDADVVAAADQAGIAMVFTGMRHFRH